MTFPKVTPRRSVLFLDVDGVLNRCGKSHRVLEPDLLANLVRIYDATDCRIVLSSTWRLYPRSMALLEYELTELGLEIDSCTPDLAASAFPGSAIIVTKQRGDEIQAWMDEFGKPTRYCILDDNSDMAHLKHHLVQTNSYEGLTDAHAERAIEMLNYQHDLT